MDDINKFTRGYSKFEYCLACVHFTKKTGFCDALKYTPHYHYGCNSFRKKPSFRLPRKVKLPSKRVDLYTQGQVEHYRNKRYLNKKEGLILASRK